jgi:hypothetical protein
MLMAERIFEGDDEMTGFRILLIIGWAALGWITFQAGHQLGWDKAGDVFLGDLSHPWRAQFNIDFGIHLLLVAAWMIWSASNRVLGVVFGVLAIIGGGMFTLAYLLVRSIQTGGNMRAVLLGRHYA